MKKLMRQKYSLGAANVISPQVALKLPKTSSLMFLQKKIGAILGYHYRFADFETDPEKLKKRFDINLVTYQEQIIKQVLSHRIQIGVITETFLKKYLRENSEDREKITISDTYDQEYNFIGIVRKKALISASELEQIIVSVTKSSKYQWISDQYGIKWQN